MPLGQGEEASGGARSASIMNEAFCFEIELLSFQ